MFAALRFQVSLRLTADGLTPAAAIPNHRHVLSETPQPDDDACVLPCPVLFGELTADPPCPVSGVSRFVVLRTVVSVIAPSPDGDVLEVGLRVIRAGITEVSVCQ